MTSSQKTVVDSLGWKLPLATVAIAAWKCFPALPDAWKNDLYSRGAPISFAVWLLTFLFLIFHNRVQPFRPSALWIGASLLFCTAGTLSGLRVLDYLSLAFALPGLAGLRSEGVLSSIAACSWLPSAGWFISRVKTGGLEGWERPAFAALMAVILLAVKSGTKNSNHS